MALHTVSLPSGRVWRLAPAPAPVRPLSAEVALPRGRATTGVPLSALATPVMMPPAEWNGGGIGGDAVSVPSSTTRTQQQQ